MAARGARPEEVERPLGARWAAPLAWLDDRWTRFETWLVIVALALEISSMSLWVFLKGMSTPSGGGSPAGVVFRSIAGATVIGLSLHFGLATRHPVRRRAWTIVGVTVGLLLGKAWASVGVDYTSNLLNWYQQASFLTLLGGLRGVGTRLTLLLALLGGSLATARGKHIVIDVATRFVGHRPRVAMIIAGWLFSAAVSGGAAWGFFDHIAIQSFGAPANAAAHEKLDRVRVQLVEELFIARKQLSLDLESVPHILLRGEPYAGWLKGPEWNAWLDGSGMVERYGRAEVDALKLEPTDARPPLVVIPGRGEPRGELIDAANLVFPIGLVVIAIRFLVRSLLVLGGYASAESDDGDEFPEARESEPGSEAKARP